MKLLGYVKKVKKEFDFDEFYTDRTNQSMYFSKFTDRSELINLSCTSNC